MRTRRIRSNPGHKSFKLRSFWSRFKLRMSWTWSVRACTHLCLPMFRRNFRSDGHGSTMWYQADRKSCGSIHHYIQAKDQLEPCKVQISRPLTGEPGVEISKHFITFTAKHLQVTCNIQWICSEHCKHLASTHLPSLDSAKRHLWQWVANCPKHPKPSTKIGNC